MRFRSEKKEMGRRGTCDLTTALKERILCSNHYLDRAFFQTFLTIESKKCIERNSLQIYIRNFEINYELIFRIFLSPVTYELS